MEDWVAPSSRLREGKWVGVPSMGLSKRLVFPPSTYSTCCSDHLLWLLSVHESTAGLQRENEDSYNPTLQEQPLPPPHSLPGC